MKIISGLQSGADQFGLDYAKAHDIFHEANTHAYFKSTDGEDLRTLGYWYHINIVTKNTGIQGLRDRTLYNVQNSDATIIFIDSDINKTRGSNLTKKYCQKHNKPYIIIPISTGNLQYQPISYNVINIAGQRKFQTPKAKEKIFKILNSLLGEYI